MDNIPGVAGNAGGVEGNAGGRDGNAPGAQVALEVVALLTALTNQLRTLTVDPRKGQPFFTLCEKDPLRGSIEEDVHKYFQNFEYLANLVPGITDELRHAELKKCLRDRALIVFQAGTQQETGIYANAKTYLLEKLVLRHQRTIFRQTLQSKRKDKETVSDFLSRS